MSRSKGRAGRGDGGGPGAGRRWIAAALAVAVAAAAMLAWWRGDEERPRSSLWIADPIARGAEAPHEIMAVRGNPGFEALPAAERARASRPLAPEAVEWLRDHRAVVLEVARSLGVSPVALGGIVAVEKTLLTGRVDVLGEEVFRAVFGSLRERHLAWWISRQEERYRRRASGGGTKSGRFSIKDPYEWTLGPAQVSFRLAVQYEPRVAYELERPPRSAREIVRAVTSTPGNLEYAAALLAESERAYRILAGMDIGDNPGVLATLFHVGAPTVRARRLAAENADRIARGGEPQPPQVNYYGAFVNLHAEEIAGILAGE